MKKTLTALAMVGAMAFGAIATSSEADAQWRRGRGVGLGIVGGLAAGAIIGGAIASSRAYAYPRAYYPADGYVPYDGYYVSGPVACPGGYWARRPIVNPYGEVVGYSRPRYFCPPY